MGAIQAAAIFTFFLVYLGMILGSWPGLALDRTGIALLGAIVFIELLGLPTEEAVRFIDLSALSILFSFMIISAQFYFSGFYTMVAAGLGRWQLQPGSLLSVIIAVSASLSAVLINDIVCEAMRRLSSKNPAATNEALSRGISVSTKTAIRAMITKIPFAACQGSKGGPWTAGLSALSKCQRPFV